ncbi:MAG: CRISPR-associated endonuclease Cas2 [Cyanothece sp. SIO2G6]|nr:CRISPR-associated endonuclease Cas2 [Cyanothece sp. SIO2G6]
MLVLVTYDSPNDRRRLKLSNFLEGYGRRVQYSVFECFLTLHEMQILYRRVETIADKSEDNVRFYWLSREAVAQVKTIGSDPPCEPPNAYIV